jgi:nicotinamidase-related amidase
MALPTPGMVIERPRTALVITDLQNDFLSPGGAAWELVRDSLATNNTIENIEALLRAARDGAYPVILSPHYYYPPDKRWVAPGGALEVLMGRPARRVRPERLAHARRVRRLRGGLAGAVQAVPPGVRHRRGESTQGVRTCVQ